MGTPHTKFRLSRGGPGKQPRRQGSALWKRFQRKEMFSSERPRGGGRSSFRDLKKEERIDLFYVTPQGTTRTRNESSKEGQRHVLPIRVIQHGTGCWSGVSSLTLEVSKLWRMDSHPFGTLCRSWPWKGVWPGWPIQTGATLDLKAGPFTFIF